MIPLKPFLHPALRELLGEADLLRAATQNHDGPVHIIVPAIMEDNIATLQSTFAKLGAEVAIHYAHKASRASAFVATAKKAGIHIDVASLGELESALARGFSGEQISCTGPKSDAFLGRAAQLGCLIAVDSFAELVRLEKQLEPQQTARILIRLNDLSAQGRKLQVKASRFGVSKQQLPAMYDWFKAHTNITLLGFHYHHDGYDSNAKTEFLRDLLFVMQDAYQQGFSPRIIDLGGSLRAATLQDPSAWQDYVDDLCQLVREGKPAPVWGTNPYGLTTNDVGAVVGREKLLSLSSSDSPQAFLSAILTSEFSAGQTLLDTLNENFFTLMIEPGYALIYNAGISLFTVMEVKESSDGNSFVVLNGNMFHLASKMFEPISDPQLLAWKVKPLPGGFSGYLVGNLCREDDFLMKRQVHFPQKPQPGDIIIFANTAAYASDFEESAAIQQTPGKKIVAQKDNGRWKILSQETNENEERRIT